MRGSPPCSRRHGPKAACSEALECRVLLAGLTGQYFDRVDFTDLKLTRTDATVAFDWGAASPDAGIGAEGFAVRWTGQVESQFSEDYTFYVRSDDGARLWVDGRLILDNWVRQSVTEKSATIPLTGGRRYDIRLDYHDVVQSAQVALSWSSRSQAKQTIPSTRLFPSPSGLAATYYDNQDFTGTSVTRTDAAVDFDWGSGPPDPAIAPTSYSARWTGQLVPEHTQTYSFFVTHDAGAQVRLRVDRELVYSSDSVQPSREVRLEAGARYDVELEYSYASGAARVRLEWASPSVPRQAIPAGRLVAAKPGAVPTRQVTYTNPTTDLKRADPGVLYSDGYYWMTHTTGGPSTGWPLYRSADLLNWTSMGNMLTLSNKPAFMDDGSFWAPEIAKVNGRYVITGTARSTWYASRTTIAIATASEITGPYTVRSTPIVAESTSGTLDSTVFQDWDGRVYLIWKRQSSDGTAANGSIRMRELDPANPTEFAAGSAEVVLLNNAGGGAWERNIEEAPEMIRRRGYYYLFYSGSTIDTTYAVGVARATSLTGAYTRYPGNVPILQSNATWGGPGHGAFVQDVDGTVWFYYHARHQDNPDYGRVQLMDKVIWTADGWPTFGGGTPSTTPQVGPRLDVASGSGRYTVAGDAGGVTTDDVIRIGRAAADAALLEVTVNGILTLSAPFGKVETLTLSGGGGNDTLLLDYSRGECVPGSGVTFAGSTGTDTVRVVGASGTDAYRLADGRVTHDTGSVAYSGVERVVVQTGGFRVEGDLASVALDATGADTAVTFATAAQRLGAVTLEGAAAGFAAAAGSALTVTSVTIGSGGALDLGDNSVLVDYAGATPAAVLRGYLLTGRNGGTWNGGGIASSAVAATPGQAIGYAEAQAVGVTTFGGHAVDGTAVVLKGVRVGDTNLDGVVDADDLVRTDRGRAMGLGFWVHGDMDYDGAVTDADLLLTYEHYLGAAGVVGPVSLAALRAEALPVVTSLSVPTELSQDESTGKGMAAGLAVTPREPFPLWGPVASSDPKLVKELESRRRQPALRRFFSDTSVLSAELAASSN